MKQKKLTAAKLEILQSAKKKLKRKSPENRFY